MAAKENAVFLGPPGTGKPHLAIGLASGRASPATALSSPRPRSGWPRLAEAHHSGRLQQELTSLGRYPLRWWTRWATSSSSLVLSIVAGIILFADPGAGALAIAIIIGIYALLFGAVMIASGCA